MAISRQKEARSRDYAVVLFRMSLLLTIIHAIIFESFSETHSRVKINHLSATKTPPPLWRLKGALPKFNSEPVCTKFGVLSGRQFFLEQAGDVSFTPGPSSFDFLRMATLNIRSLTSKYASFSDLVLSKKLDVVAITETWLTPTEILAGLADLTLQGFKFIHQRRQSKTGGGVAVIVRDRLNVTRCNISQFSDFEAMCCKITASLYSPSNHNLSCLFAYFDLRQHVDFPTHIHGQWLDLLKAHLLHISFQTLNFLL